MFIKYKSQTFIQELPSIIEIRLTLSGILSHWDIEGSSEGQNKAAPNPYLHLISLQDPVLHFLWLLDTSTQKSTNFSTQCD